MSGISLALGLSQAGFAEAMPPAAPALQVLTTPEGTLEFLIDDDDIVITLTAPAAFAGIYTIAGADLASGPVNLVAARISGGPETGAVLTGTPGLWVYDHTAATPVLAYQWQADGVDIPGATTLSYTTVPANAGADIRLVETAAQASVGARSVPSNAITTNGAFTENGVSLTGTQYLEFAQNLLTGDADELLIFFSGITPANVVYLSQVRSGTTNDRLYHVATRLPVYATGYNNLVGSSVPTTRYHMLCYWKRDGANTVTTYYLAQPGGSWASIGTTSHAAFTLDTTSGKFSMFGDGSPSFTGTVYRMAVWAGTGAGSVPDASLPDVRDAFVSADKASIADPAAINTMLGAPLWDIWGTAADFNSGVNKGTVHATATVNGVFG